MPATAAQHFLGDIDDDVLDLAAAVGPNSAEKLLSFTSRPSRAQTPRAGDAERKASFVYRRTSTKMSPSNSRTAAGSKSLRSGARASPRFSSQ